MAYLVLVMSLPNESMQAVKDQVNQPTKAREILQGVEQAIIALKSGEKRSDNAYVVVRDSDPSVSTSGSGSVSLDCSKP